MTVINQNLRIFCPCTHPQILFQECHCIKLFTVNAGCLIYRIKIADDKIKILKLLQWKVHDRGTGCQCPLLPVFRSCIFFNLFFRIFLRTFFRIFLRTFFRIFLHVFFHCTFFLTIHSCTLLIFFFRFRLLIFLCQIFN